MHIHAQLLNICKFFKNILCFNLCASECVVCARDVRGGAQVGIFLMHLSCECVYVCVCVCACVRVCISVCAFIKVCESK